MKPYVFSALRGDVLGRVLHPKVYPKVDFEEGQ